MKFLLAILCCFGLCGQTPRLTTVSSVNKHFLESCTQAEKMFMRLRGGEISLRDELIDLVITLDNQLIYEMEERNKEEIRALRPAIVCTRSVSLRVAQAIIPPEVRKRRNFKTLFFK